MRWIRLSPLVRIRLSLLAALLIALVALVMDNSSGDDAGAISGRTLIGETGQGRPLEMVLNKQHRVEFFDTRLTATCTDGQAWGTRWYPAEGAPIHFSHRDGEVTATERTEHRFEDGTVGRIGSTMHGRVVDGGDAVEGTMRLVARFYRGGVETAACDSGYVQWAVGRDYGARLAKVPIPG